MRSSTVIYALLWKEWRAVMPLVFGVALLAIMLYAVTMLASGDRDAAYMSYLLVLPNLVAFGISALQVGHEDEMGTLQWQRSLPVSVTTVLTSKLLIALLAVAILWLTCAAGYWVAVQTGNARQISSNLIPVDSTPAVEIVRLISFTLMLLACSFFSSWLIRSPAAGLLVAAALIVLATFGSLVLSEWSSAGNAAKYAASEGYKWLSAWVIFYQTVFTCVLLVGAWLLARRRWANNSVLPNFWRNGSEPHPAYLPVKAISQSAPTMNRALIWQAVRQARGSYAVVACLMVVAGIQHIIFEQQPPTRSDSGFVIIAAMISTGLLGIATFAGDANRQRIRFLAERGVGRWHMWWTRMIVPVILFGLIIGGCLISELVARQSYSAPPLLPALALFSGIFVTGSISAMWAQRPIVGYLGTPLLLGIAIALMDSFWGLYNDYFWPVVLGIAVLLGCTLRMVRRWSEGQRAWGYHGRFVGWYCLAGLAIVAPVIGYRLLTIPAHLPDWRQQTHAAAVGLQFEVELKENEWLEYRPIQFWGAGLTYQDNVIQQAIADIESGEEVLLDKDQGQRVFHHFLLAPQAAAHRAAGNDVPLSVDDLLAVLFSGINKLSGMPLTLESSDYLDRLEWTATQALLDPSIQQELGAERLAHYAVQLRTPQQRRLDRRNSLLLSWAFHNSAGWTPFAETAGLIDPKAIGELLEQDDPAMINRVFSFAGYTIFGVPKRAQLIGFERTRLLRHLDQAAKISLQQANAGTWPQAFDYVNGGPFNAETLEEAKRISAWSDVGLRAGSFFQGYYAWSGITGLWNSEVEQKTEQARSLGDK